MRWRYPGEPAEHPTEVELTGEAATRGHLVHRHGAVGQQSLGVLNAQFEQTVHRAVAVGLAEDLPQVAGTNKQRVGQFAGTERSIKMGAQQGVGLGDVVGGGAGGRDHGDDLVRLLHVRRNQSGEQVEAALIGAASQFADQQACHRLDHRRDRPNAGAQAVGRGTDDAEAEVAALAMLHNPVFAAGLVDDSGAAAIGMAPAVLVQHAIAGQHQHHLGTGMAVPAAVVAGGIVSGKGESAGGLGHGLTLDMPCSVPGMPGKAAGGRLRGMSLPFIIPPGGIDPDRIATCFAEHGVVVLPGLFSRGEMAAADAALAEWVASPDSQAAPQRPDAFQRHQTQVVSWDPINEGRRGFAELRDHPRLAAVTAAAIGIGSWGDGCMVMLSRPGQLQAWHQDTNSDDPTQFFINRLLYPWDVDPRAGAIVCVPGSQRAGTIPPGDPHGPIAGEVLLAPTAGTLVILHSRCFHRVTRNETTGLRLSVNFRVHPAGSAHDLGRYGVYRTGTYDFATNTNTRDARA